MLKDGPNCLFSAHFFVSSNELHREPLARTSWQIMIQILCFLFVSSSFNYFYFNYNFITRKRSDSKFLCDIIYVSTRASKIGCRMNFLTGVAGVWRAGVFDSEGKKKSFLALLEADWLILAESSFRRSLASTCARRFCVTSSSYFTAAPVFCSGMQISHTQD